MENEKADLNWIDIESEFFNRYKSNNCISFDYELHHDFPPEDVGNLLRLVSNRKGHCPFNVFYLGSFTLAVKTFLETCAPFITELHLAHWSFRDENFFTEGVPKNMNFAALKKLDIKLIIEDDDHDTFNIRNFFVFIAEIFKGSPSLQELSCIIPGVWGGEAIEELLRSLAAYGDNGLLSSLKYLKLRGCFLPTHFLTLSALDDLQLEILALQFCGVLGPTFSKYIKRFLQSQSSGLERLHLKDVDSTSITIVFPMMDKLKKLKISGSHVAGIGMTFEGIEYSKQFPTLESLTLIRVGEKEWKNFTEGHTPACRTLKRLIVKDSHVNRFHFTTAGRIKTKLVFPNLEEFLHE